VYSEDEPLKFAYLVMKGEFELSKTVINTHTPVIVGMLQSAKEK
jgi:hypothetical protein